ncbi:hypothetical protein ABT160_16680 [Streptomyces sp. NPDC001941]|uniref:hypothetical protein n=1 Tax=Streptomyces sp. NPDC001941 TaxID=3154659 RepID=UPI00331D3574
MTQSHAPHGRPVPPPTRPGPRPGAATAAGLLGTLFGGAMAAAGAGGAVATLLWTLDAGPGQSRGAGGAIGIVFCLLGAAFGYGVARAGLALLKGAPGSADRMAALLTPVAGLSFVGTVNGMLDDDTAPDSWALRMTAFVAVLVCASAGIALARARATVAFAPGERRRR